jgi:PAS domain S-box-containing protein
MDVKKILYEIKTSENAGKYLQDLLKDSYDHDHKRMFDLLFQESVGLFCVIGFDNHFKKISRSFGELLGYTDAELTGLPVEALIVDEKQGSDHSASFSAQNLPSSFENKYLCKNGETRWLSWKCATDTEKQCVYATIEDITAYKEEVLKNQSLQQQLREKDKTLEYAKSLQDVLMPYKSMLDKYFKDFFVLNLPKEVLSGNFCWMEKTNEKIYIAVADCAWYGVPGALMSVACSNALTRTLFEFKITETGKMLDKVRELVADIFRNSDIKAIDGMDISLCCINKQTCVIEWSGANNQLLFLHNGIVQELVGDKHAISASDSPLPFTTHKMYLSKSDTIYLFSDGYADQFGGEAGKKMLYKKFQSLLVKLAPLNMDRQREKLQTEFEKWKGEMQQDDDVLVIGLRI